MKRDSIIFQNSYLQSESTQRFIQWNLDDREEEEEHLHMKGQSLSKSIGKNKKLTLAVSLIAIFLVSVFTISLGIYFIKSIFTSRSNIRPLLSLDQSRAESYNIFQQFKADFNKFYPDIEQEAQRYQIFHSNYEYIYSKNSNNSLNTAIQYTLGINQFADLTQDQFRQKYTGLIAPSASKSYLDSYKQKQLTPQFQSNLQIPQKQDLSKFCLPARNQSTCGSCWAFASTSAIQCENSKIYNVKQQLSPQQLIDCSFDYKNAGCVGGLMQYAYDYILDNNITTQLKYPYTNSEHFCRFQGGKFSIKGYKSVNPFSIDAHLLAFSQHFVTVAINASDEIRFYNSGVLSEEAICGPNVNHGVVVTGYEIIYKEDKKCMRLKMKNSWGSQYGQNGYFYGDVCNNWCGMLAMSTYVIV